MTRLYLDQARFASALPQLDDGAARHLRDVLRLRPGAELRVFDGAGHERTATIATIDRRGVTLSLGVTVEPLPEPPVPVTLACAFPRGQRGDWIVEKATELGAAHLVALASERGVLRPGPGRLDRWRRIAVEASEQCGRATLPAIEEGEPVFSPGSLALIAIPGATLGVSQAVRQATVPASVTLLVGPEGGWSTEERAARIAAGAIPVGLGPRVLRTETAAIAGLTQLVATIEGTDTL